MAMDNSLTPKKQTSIAQAQQVMMLLYLDSKLTIEQACKSVGITERQYRYWLTKGDQAIESTRELIDNQQRELISEIAFAKASMIRTMIKKAKDELVKPIDLVILYKVLSQELDELQNVYNVRPGIEEEAQAFLKRGPTIEKKKSRFASIDIEETESGFRIGLNEEKPIVDGEIVEPIED